MKAAAAALVAAAVFFAGVLFGPGERSVGAPIPRPVIVVTTGSAPEPSGRTEARNAPAPEDLSLEEVEHQVQEGSVTEYGDGYDEDEAEREEDEPESEPDEDDSGPGSDDSGPGSDNSGPGSGSSGSGSGGSGSG